MKELFEKQDKEFEELKTEGAKYLSKRLYDKLCEIPSKIREETLQAVKEKAERVKLDVDVIICDCGFPFKESDLSLSVDDLLKSLDI